MPAPLFTRMKPNHDTRHPAALAFFDTETVPIPIKRGKGAVRHVFRLLVARAVRIEATSPTRASELHTANLAEFWAWLESHQSPSRPLWVFAHNLPFDWTESGFWERLEQGEYAITGPGSDVPDQRGRKKRPFRGRLVLEGRPTYAYTLGRRGRVNWCDTGNFWPGNLESLGQSLGLPKLPMPAFEAPDEDWYTYCARDVAIIERAVTGMFARWEQDDLGVWQPTAPSMALASFRHLAPTLSPLGARVLPLTDRRAELVELERTACYGGHVEAFYLGEIHHALDDSADANKVRRSRKPAGERGPVWHLDVRNLYGSIMRDGLFPTRRWKLVRQPTVRKLGEYVCGLGVAAEVLIDSPADTYPAKVNGLQVHGRGRFWTSLCGAELTRALAAEHVADCRWCLLYPLAPIFREWVSYWDDRRCRAEDKGDEPDALYCKLMIVSLAGKFAQHGKRWVEREGQPRRQQWGTWIDMHAQKQLISRVRAVGGIVQVEELGPDPVHSFPAIFAFITSAARERMRALRQVAGERGVYYQATDSLLVGTDGYTRLDRAGEIAPRTLGKLRIKGQHDTAEIWGSNWYRLDDQWIRSGAWGRARFTPGKGWWFEQWQTLQATIATRPDGSIIVERRALRHEEGQDKQQYGPDGWGQPFDLTGHDPRAGGPAAQQVE